MLRHGKCPVLLQAFAYLLYIFAERGEPLYVKNASRIMKKDASNSWLRYLGLTAQLLVLIGLAVYAAIWLDKKLGVAPLFIILLPLLVLGITFYNLYKETIKKKQ